MTTLITRSRFLATLGGLIAAPFVATRAMAAVPTPATPTCLSSEDLAAALTRAGGAAKEANISLDALIAHVTKAQLATARGGAVIGNALNAIYERSSQRETQLALMDAGLKQSWDDLLVKHPSWTYHTATVFDNLQAQWSNLSASQRARVCELMGGVRNANIARAIIA